jgi:hypothetical protein
LNELLAGGFALALIGITEDELSKLSVGVAALEAMPELPDGHADRQALHFHDWLHCRKHSPPLAAGKCTRRGRERYMTA